MLLLAVFFLAKRDAIAGGVLLAKRDVVYKGKFTGTPFFVDLSPHPLHNVNLHPERLGPGTQISHLPLLHRLFSFSDFECLIEGPATTRQPAERYEHQPQLNRKPTQTLPPPTNMPNMARRQQDLNHLYTLSHIQEIGGKALERRYNELKKRYAK